MVKSIRKYAHHAVDFENAGFDVTELEVTFMTQK